MKETCEQERAKTGDKLEEKSMLLWDNVNFHRCNVIRWCPAAGCWWGSSHSTLHCWIQLREFSQYEDGKYTIGKHIRKRSLCLPWMQHVMTSQQTPAEAGWDTLKAASACTIFLKEFLLCSCFYFCFIGLFCATNCCLFLSVSQWHGLSRHSQAFPAVTHFNAHLIGPISTGNSSNEEPWFLHHVCSGLS